MTIYWYARVSTDGQTLDAQIEALRAAGAATVFQEKVSGAKTDRAQLSKLMGTLGAGDVLLDSIGDVVRRVAVPSAVANARIVSSELGGRAQALGALAVVFQNDEHIGRVIDDFAFKA